MPTKRNPKIPVFSLKEEDAGRLYREQWYKERNHDMVFSWYVLSQETKTKWILSALAARNRTEVAA